MSDLHQSLMDQAYDRFRANPRMHHEEFWDTLDAKERFAVHLGNFNYQVENGGFSQWDFNGYSANADYVIRALKRVGTPSALRAVELVEEFQELKADADEDDIVRYDHLDRPYYDVNDELMADIERHLQEGKC